jgi:hypothetical protein
MRGVAKVVLDVDEPELTAPEPPQDDEPEAKPSKSTKTKARSLTPVAVSILSFSLFYGSLN